MSVTRAVFPGFLVSLSSRPEANVLNSHRTSLCCIICAFQVSLRGGFWRLLPQKQAMLTRVAAAVMMNLRQLR
jgi:hypothetical protein